jgi:hypothetical protein
VHPLASVAVTVNGKLPVCNGVPERSPPTKVTPMGSGKISLKLTAPTPPVCVNITGVIAVPAKTNCPMPDGLTVMIGQLMTNVYDWLPVQEFESVAVILIGKLPV